MFSSKVGIFLCLFLVVLGLVLLLLFKKTPGQQLSGHSVAPTATITSIPSPTPMPFYEITIPYLRSREYKSQLASLQKVGSEEKFTSYLTSYFSDGLKINSLLTIPTGRKPDGGWSAIVFIHGYIPPNQYKTTERYVDYVNTLARNGFVVLKIDLRGHGSSEGESGGGYYSADYVIDALNAYAALQNADFVNKNNIGFWGHSMAGNIVARALSVRTDAKAGVIWAGAGYSYVDLNTYGITDSSYKSQPNESQTQQKRQNLIDDYGYPKDGNRFWKLVAPTSYLSDYKGAIEIHHAKDDPTVSIKYSEDLNTFLDKTTIPHEFYQYQTGGHNISGSSFTLAMQRTVDFFKHYLKN